MKAVDQTREDFAPERLTLARERRGYKKSDLARRIRLNPRTIGEYEAGRSVPDDTIIGRIVDTLNFPVEFFFIPTGSTMTEDGASFRALSRITAAQRKAALAIGSLGVELYGWIEDKFNLPDPDIPDLQPGITDPEGAASMVRAQWGLGYAPISHVLHTMERHGVRFISLAEEWREVDAFSEWIDGTPYVCLSTHKTAERSIFDAAHELGHLVLHRDHASPRGRAEERQADAFASAFLMPKADVDAHARRNLDFAQLVDLKSRWRVSVAALNYRLHQLGWSTEWHYRELCIELGQFGRNREPNGLPREQSQVLSKVFSALRSERISRQDIAESLRITSDELNALTFGLAMTLLDGGNEGGHEPSRRPELRLIET